MKKEIRDFYALKDLHINKLVARGKLRGLTKSQVEEAIVIIYKRIQSGEKIKPIKIAWEVWSLAKGLKSNELAEENLTIEGLRNSLHKRKLYETITANILIWVIVVYEIWRLIYGS